MVLSGRSFLMSLARRRFIVTAGAVAVLLVSRAGGPVTTAVVPTAATEVRALWVVRTTLTSPASVDAMVRAARDAGFNTLIVQVRGRGDAYYMGGLEPRPQALAKYPSFDPLAEIIARARRAGLTVHAWVNVNLVANATDLPTAKGHVVNRHPEWLMVPRELAAELAASNPRKPKYVQRLAGYVKGRNDVEGLYLSPLTQESADYTVQVIRTIAARYAVDGIHLDYSRYPSNEFDYSRPGLAEFRRSIVDGLSSAERRRYDKRLKKDPTTYAQAYPERWRAFRRARLTALVTNIRKAVKAARPDVVLSAAVFPDPSDAVNKRLQDWAGWAQNGILDVVCPMAYTTDAALFESQIAMARTLAAPRPLWAGIGAYRLTSQQIVANIHAARRVGAGGSILFSYDSLIETGKGPGYLGALARAAFAE
jgi:uncharacterized lipoprotein YddW (UPF0748 family)